MSPPRKSAARPPGSRPGAPRGATGAAPRGPARPAPRQAARQTPATAAGRVAPAAATADLDGAFRAARAVLERHLHSLQVLFNTPENYTLASRRREPQGLPQTFGAVLRRKSHVTVELPPLARLPELTRVLPAELKACQQGKSSFTLTAPDALVLAQLDQLARAVLLRLRQDGQA